jgi:hypothetical protein
MGFNQYFKVRNSLIKDPRFTTHGFWTLIVLLSHEREGQCWPSIATIAQEARISKTSVKKSLKELEALKILHRKRRFEQGSRELKSNLYILDPSVLCGAPEDLSRASSDQHVGRRVTICRAPGDQELYLVNKNKEELHEEANNQVQTKPGLAASNEFPLQEGLAKILSELQAASKEYSSRYANE